MRKLLMPLIGTGTEGDPLRVDLPTYRVIRQSSDGRSAVIEVPDPDFPEDAAWDALPRDAEGARDAESLPLSALERWHAHLDERYKGHPSGFRPLWRRPRTELPRG